jgi:hypothetical protein
VPLIIVDPRDGRGGADRRSIVREDRSLNRLTAADQPLVEGALGGKPLMVLTRGPGNRAAVAEEWRRWHGLHEDLARLSANSRHVIAASPAITSTNASPIWSPPRSGKSCAARERKHLWRRSRRDEPIHGVMPA